ncbi:MAG: M14 family zinc carboxypeptidase [Candidatus Heimdallarchaeaceae archaeon]|jgi:hypothetical protein
MNRRRALYTLFIGILLLNFQYDFGYSLNFQEVNYQIDVDYKWFWEELYRAPDSIFGEDVVYWGENLGPYHNYTELTEKLVSLNATFPSMVDLFSIGQTYLGNEIWCVKITDEMTTTAKMEYYIVGLHHARELISVENSLYFIDKLIFDAQQGNYTNLLSTTEIYVIPMLNPDGLSIIHWFPEQRKNLRSIDDDEDGSIEDELERVYYWNISTNTSDVREIDLDLDLEIGEDRPGGVDLNRNYAAFWNVSGGSSEDKHDDVFRGEYPLSENETLAIQEFMDKHFFNFAVSLHSGIEAIITPWGYNLSLPINDEAEFQALIDELKLITGFPAWNETGGYQVSGGWDDFCYLYYDIMSFTIETYEETWSGLYFDHYNPPGDHILENCELTFPALMFLASSPQLTYNNQYPSIQVTNPSTINQVFENYTIRWTMDDPENAPLNCTVLVSKNGWNWTILESNLIDTSSFFWDLEDVSPGSYYLKIAVSDGENWISDVADIRLNVKRDIPGSTAAFWILAVIVGGSALLLFIMRLRKQKDMSRAWGPDPYQELKKEQDKNSP